MQMYLKPRPCCAYFSDNSMIRRPISSKLVHYGLCPFSRIVQIMDGTNLKPLCACACQAGISRKLPYI